MTIKEGLRRVFRLGTILFASAVGLSVTFGMGGANRARLCINPGWRFEVVARGTGQFAENYDDSSWEIVSLPHSHDVFSANLVGFDGHGRELGWYRRTLSISKEWLDKKLYLEFQGAMEATTVWVNGKEVGEYAVSGFDSFHFDITSFVHEGANLLAVMVDNRIRGDSPPDGVETDYILFGGLYRDVFLDVVDHMHLTFPWEGANAGVRVTLPTFSKAAAVVEVESTVRNESDSARLCTLVTEILDQEGKVLLTVETNREIASKKEQMFTQQTEPLLRPHLWSPDNPYLYKVVSIVREGDKELDRVENPLGIRWVKFDKEKGFFLNDEHLKLVGANRHQTWPFIGGAVPNGLQRRDAEQMKAMGINWVRLSHYPQDPDFLDALDELGLMAMEEPPTWMQAGQGKWMDNLEKSFRRMIRRDRNHPCIMLWSTCINHQPANERLVKAAAEEDPTRGRGQDNVPIPMNFIPLKISGGGALTIEHTGHTFPTLRGARLMTFRPPDGARGIMETNVNREYEQAKRHWEQVNAAYLKEDNSGLAVWCMYDYNTFHNIIEPGIAWHGVCDLFRIPKFSYWWHMSELTSKPMAYVVRVDADRAAVFSNCEQVRLWEDEGHGYREAATHTPDTGFTTREGQHFSYALHHPPFHFMVSSKAIALKAEGLVDGQIKATYEWKAFGAPVALKLEADRPTITADGADLSRIIVSAVDTNGTPVDTFSGQVTFAIAGLGQLIGENPTKLRAGKMIILAQSGFVPDELTVRAESPGLLPAKVTIRTEPVPPNVDMPKDLPVKQPTRRVIVSNSIHERFPAQANSSASK